MHSYIFIYMMLILAYNNVSDLPLQILMSVKQMVTAVNCVKMKWDHFTALVLIASH